MFSVQVTYFHLSCDLRIARIVRIIFLCLWNAKRLKAKFVEFATVLSRSSTYPEWNLPRKKCVRKRCHIKNYFRRRQQQLLLLIRSFFTDQKFPRKSADSWENLISVGNRGSTYFNPPSIFATLFGEQVTISDNRQSFIGSLYVFRSGHRIHFKLISFLRFPQSHFNHLASN